MIFYVLQDPKTKEFYNGLHCNLTLASHTHPATSSSASWTLTMTKLIRQTVKFSKISEGQWVMERTRQFVPDSNLKIVKYNPQTITPS